MRMAISIITTIMKPKQPCWMRMTAMSWISQKRLPSVHRRTLPQSIRENAVNRRSLPAVTVRRPSCKPLCAMSTTNQFTQWMFRRSQIQPTRKRPKGSAYPFLGVQEIGLTVKYCGILEIGLKRPPATPTAPWACRSSGMKPSAGRGSFLTAARFGRRIPQKLLSIRMRTADWVGMAFMWRCCAFRPARIRFGLKPAKRRKVLGVGREAFRYICLALDGNDKSIISSKVRRMIENLTNFQSLT